MKRYRRRVRIAAGGNGLGIIKAQRIGGAGYHRQPLGGVAGDPDSSAWRW
jgi:hypothetical protein